MIVRVVADLTMTAADGEERRVRVLPRVRHSPLMRDNAVTYTKTFEGSRQQLMHLAASDVQVHRLESTVQHRPEYVDRLGRPIHAKEGSR